MAKDGKYILHFLIAKSNPGKKDKLKKNHFSSIKITTRNGWELSHFKCSNTDCKESRNILELFRADKMRAAKSIPANLNFNVRYEQFSLSFH